MGVSLLLRRSSRLVQSVGGRCFPRSAVSRPLHLSQPRVPTEEKWTLLLTARWGHRLGWTWEESTGCWSRRRESPSQTDGSCAGVDEGWAQPAPPPPSSGANRVHPPVDQIQHKLLQMLSAPFLHLLAATCFARAPPAAAKLARESVDVRRGRGRGPTADHGPLAAAGMLEAARPKPFTLVRPSLLPTEGSIDGESPHRSLSVSELFARGWRSRAGFLLSIDCLQ